MRRVRVDGTYQSLTTREILEGENLRAKIEAMECDGFPKDSSCSENSYISAINVKFDRPALCASCSVRSEGGYVPSEQSRTIRSPTRDGLEALTLTNSQILSDSSLMNSVQEIRCDICKTEWMLVDDQQRRFIWIRPQACRTCRSDKVRVKAVKEDWRSRNSPTSQT
ncbi:uncharacterized protein I206_102143 [Kwoniella pini CBS 10737]|uniref:Uncharacterized protein n=1 Tax=Kwoniella pini CBS 10737 TaxID=1296096 RepID=A0A1B9HUP8_9TREE|nr:uncharacterized protein I206_06764 [Kwoniella pini CBS 10737]OCF46990.1 hypothetical protein I206_06764 [Kwoniella pini CBS 10737]